jgi:pyrroline-5-carboxylate reductase
MTGKTIGFIGGGRVTRILLESWQRAIQMPGRITVCDPNADVLSKLKSRFPGIDTGPAGAAAAQDIVFLAVHPPAVADAAAQIKPALRPESLVVSLAPKFTMAKLSALLSGFNRIARVIPNAPSIIGAGYNPIAFAPLLNGNDRLALIALIAPAGECPEVPEEKLEAYAVLTAMGPTYLWFQLQALREVAAGCGLSDAQITPALKRMVCGATRTLLESGLTPAEVMDLVPVKPLAEMEAQVTELYQTRLPAIFQKIKP